MTDARFAQPHRFAQPNFSQADTFITPELAREMLAFNSHNRQQHDYLVRQYASDMLDCRWRETHVPILFDRNGALVDGQHRLAAIIASGVPLRTIVICGLDPSCRDAVDIGKQRSIADVLTLAGHSYSNLTTGVARLVIAFERGANLFSTHMSAPLVQAFLLDRPYLMEVVAFVGPRRFLAPSSMLGAICFLANEDRRLDNAIADFLDGLSTGENLPRGDARLTLRNWLVAEKKRSRDLREHVSRHRIFAAIARAWTAYARQENLGQFRELPKVARKDTVPIYGMARPADLANSQQRQGRPAADGDEPHMTV